MIRGHEETLATLLKRPWVESRHGRTKEIENANICLDPVAEMLCPFRWRQLDIAYVGAQLAWYLRADPHEKFIRDYCPEMWDRTDFLDINSNYGVYVFTSQFGSQFDVVYHRLVADPATRNAVVLFNHHKCNTSETRDPICTTSLQFLIRNGSMDCIATMRSNSWWNGFCYDSVFFMQLQEWLAAIVGVPIGLYYHNAGSFHIYEKDIQRIPSNKPVNDVLPITLPQAPSAEEAWWQRSTWDAMEARIRLGLSVYEVPKSYLRTRWMIEALCNYYSR